MMKGSLVFLCFLAAVCAFDYETYLLRFGYHDPQSYHGANLTQSLILFQQTYGLKPSGVLDDATLKLMNTPRCGMMDNVGAQYRDTAWRKKALSYYYYNYSPDLSKDTIRSAIARALKYWSDVTPLTFTERNGGDINIAFGSYRHTDSRGTCRDPFDGPSKVLAHAYFPPIGRIHFDESERWTVGTRSGINLLWVSTHEMGHILGLEHDQQNRDAIMYPYYRAYDPNMHLHANDIRRIQRLYGSGGGGGGGGSCADRNRKCRVFAGRGYCRGRYARWMAANCCRSCRARG